MDVFSSLTQRTKIIVVTSALFLLSMSLSLLVFGGNISSHDAELIHAAKEGIKADMLYVHHTLGH